MSPEARVAAQGREARELGEELRAQWMASVRRPGWARRGTLSNYDLVLGDDKCSCAVASFRSINVCRRDNFHAVNTDC